MGFLLLIAFSIYGLECMCRECDLKKTLDNRPASGDSLDNEPLETDSRARRPASSRPRPGTNSGERRYGRAVDEDEDGSDGKVSIDELE